MVLRNQLTQLQGMGGIGAFIDKLPAQLAAKAANLALLRNNARVAARVAAALSGLTGFKSPGADSSRG